MKIPLYWVLCHSFSMEEVYPKGMECLKPEMALLVKLGSIAVHADEMISPKGHVFDQEALKGLLKDPEGCLICRMDGKICSQWVR